MKCQYNIKGLLVATFVMAVVVHCANNAVYIYDTIGAYSTSVTNHIYDIIDPEQGTTIILIEGVPEKATKGSWQK